MTGKEFYDILTEIECGQKAMAAIVEEALQRNVTSGDIARWEFGCEDIPQDVALVCTSIRAYQRRQDWRKSQGWGQRHSHG
jgi:hypothetical protein